MCKGDLWWRDYKNRGGLKFLLSRDSIKTNRRNAQPTFPLEDQDSPKIEFCIIKVINEKVMMNQGLAASGLHHLFIFSG